MTPELDKKDRQILRALQRNGRITDQALAEHVNLSSSPCLRRRRILEDAGFILKQLEHTARINDLAKGEQSYSSYRNTISLDQQGAYPGNLEIEHRLTATMRWNALAMVIRANG